MNDATFFQKALPWRRLTLLVILLASVTAYAKTKQAEKIAEAQKNFAYSDEKQCYVNKLPILPLIIYSQNENRDLFNAAVDTAISRECNINEADPRTGLNALNLAILLHDSDLVTRLLKNGANPKLKIRAPHEIFDQMNSVEFTNLLLANIPDDKAEFVPVYEEILSLINQQ